MQRVSLIQVGVLERLRFTDFQRPFINSGNENKNRKTENSKTKFENFGDYGAKDISEISQFSSVSADHNDDVILNSSTTTLANLHPNFLELSKEPLEFLLSVPYGFKEDFSLSDPAYDPDIALACDPRLQVYIYIYIYI